MLMTLNHAAVARFTEKNGRFGPRRPRKGNIAIESFTTGGNSISSIGNRKQDTF